MAVIETTDTIPGWSRKPKESSRALEAAQGYLKMGANRSIAAVSRTLGKHVSLLERWSTQWGWVGRATEYDDHFARQEQIEIGKQASARGEERRRRAEERSELLYRISQKILAKVEKVLELPIVSVTVADGKTTIKPIRVALKDAVPLLGIVLKIDKAADQERGKGGDLIPEEFELDDFK
jgi:hypothetical protein